MSPKIIAQMNDYHFKLVRVEGDFTWHDHNEEKECKILLIEPVGTINTGDAGGEQTAANEIWI